MMKEVALPPFWRFAGEVMIVPLNKFEKWVVMSHQRGQFVPLIF
jgi:hypothetical protein